MAVKILLFGSNGYLGSRFKNIYPDAVCPKGDIADTGFVSSILDEHKPDIVINAAGKTGKPNVDWCEDHKLETLRANVSGPLVLLEECMKRSLYLVHLGSGCIYGGDGGGKGFSEDDPPNFTESFYALTKASSDQVLKAFPVLQLRIRMPFDKEPGSRNLISKLIGYKKVIDAENSLTYLPDFFSAFQALVEKRATGIYNIVNAGHTSPYAIMERYKKLVDPSHTFERISADTLETFVKAPRSNCILSSAKLQKEGIRLRPVEEALEEALLAFKAARN